MKNERPALEIVDSLRKHSAVGQYIILRLVWSLVTKITANRRPTLATPDPLCSNFFLENNVLRSTLGVGNITAKKKLFGRS